MRIVATREGCLMGPEFFGSLTGECSHCSDGREREVEPNTFSSKNRKPKNKNKNKGKKKRTVLLPQDVKEREQKVCKFRKWNIYIYINIYIYLHICNTNASYITSMSNSL